MNSDRLYVIFLSIVIIAKVFYFISTIRMRLLERVDPQNDKLAAIKDRNQRILLGLSLIHI